MKKHILHLTEIESKCLQIALSVITILATFLNILYLIFTKSNSKKLNATEILQICKTVLVLIALCLCVPMEIIVTGGIPEVDISLCLFKDLIGNTFLDAYPFAIMAVAITRFRVCKCVGNAAVLVSRKSALATFVLCLLIPVLPRSAMILVSFSDDNALNSTNHQNKSARVKYFECSNYPQTADKTYKEVLHILVGVLPVVVTVMMYAFMYKKVSTTRNRAISIAPNGARFQNKTAPSRSVSSWRDIQDASIKTTMLLLVVMFITSWSVYFVIAIIHSIYPVKYIWYLLLLAKPLVYLFHPLAEGMFLQHKRHKTSNFLANLFRRTKEESNLDSSLSVQINSSCIRNRSTGPIREVQNTEAVSIISGSSNVFNASLNSLSSHGQDKPCQEELLSEKFISGSCLHTRRTGRALSPIIAIVDEKKEASIELYNMEPLSGNRSPTIASISHCTSPYHKARSKDIQTFFVETHSLDSNPSTPITLNVVKTPIKSCLKASNTQLVSCSCSEKSNCRNSHATSLSSMSGLNRKSCRILENCTSGKSAVRFKFSSCYDEDKDINKKSSVTVSCRSIVPTTLSKHF